MYFIRLFTLIINIINDKLFKLLITIAMDKTKTDICVEIAQHIPPKEIPTYLESNNYN